MTKRQKALVEQAVRLYIKNCDAGASYLHFFAMGFFYGDRTSRMEGTRFLHFTNPVEFADLCIEEYLQQQFDSARKTK